MVWDDNPLFNEEFEAWANGSVCRELFNKTKGFYSVADEDEGGNPSNLTARQIETIEAVLKYYAPHDAQWLSRLTHLEEPWERARGLLADGVGSNNIITKESMAVYYGGL